MKIFYNVFLLFSVFSLSKFSVGSVFAEELQIDQSNCSQISCDTDRDFNEGLNLNEIRKQDKLAVFSEDLLKNTDLKIITKFMTNNDCYNTGKKINVKGIMVHSTQIPGRKANYFFDVWNKSYKKGEINKQVCVHAFLDDTGVYQYLPWNHRGWHAGGPANNTHISFEICEPDGLIYNKEITEIISIDVEKTRDYFDKIWNNSLKLCVALCKQFNLTEKDVVCHCEGHDLKIAGYSEDVMHWWKFYGKDMNSFRKELGDLLRK